MSLIFCLWLLFYVTSKCCKCAALFYVISLQLWERGVKSAGRKTQKPSVYDDIILWGDIITNRTTTSSFGAFFSFFPLVGPETHFSADQSVKSSFKLEINENTTFKVGVFNLRVVKPVSVNNQNLMLRFFFPMTLLKMFGASVISS